MPQLRKRSFKKDVLAKVRLNQRRNDAFVDIWTIIHVVTGIAFGWIMTPVIALAVLVLWEPLEILVLSPLLARLGIVFGFESLRNSLSDILFDTLGVLISVFILAPLFQPPFFLF